MINSKSLTLGFILLFFITTINAQVGIGTTDPQGALDITSTNQGLLIPRVSLTTNTDDVTVLTPTISELVYNTNTSAVGPNQVTPGYYYWNGSLWIRLASGNSNNDWSILGNAGLSSADNFLGTTDGVDVVFKRNNLLAGRLAEISTAFGLGALNNTTVGENVAFGNNAMAAHTNGIENTAVGFNALQQKTTGAANTAIGHSALNAVGTFERATAVGFQSLLRNTANDNTGIGFQALRENTSGIQNTSLGFQAGALNNTGSSNTIIGHLAAYYNQSSDNTAIGYNALNAAAGANNVAVGSGALALNRAANNTALGYQAGVATTTGTGNVFVGNLAGSAESGETSNKLYISNSGTTATTSLIYGDFSSVPKVLRTNSQFQIGDPSGNGYVFPTERGTANQILVTDGVGILSWANSSATSNEWTILGNSNIAEDTNFIGTTNAIDVAFKRDNVAAGRIGATSTSFGVSALAANAGANNTAFGTNALAGINTGASINNVAIGYNTLTTTGTITESVAVGANALINANTNTTRNTAVGHSAGSNITSGSDNIVIGANAQVPNNADSNQIRIGGTTITSATTQIAWTLSSDKRWKNIIKDSALGLDFIQTLRPVSYVRNNDEKARTEYGFIAQEIEAALIKAGDPNNAIISKDDEGMYGVRYNDFISISVKAIQEQQEQIEALKTENELLKKANEEIIKRLEALEKK